MVSIVDSIISIIICVLKKEFQWETVDTWTVKPKEEVNDEEIAGPGLF